MTAKRLTAPRKSCDADETRAAPRLVRQRNVRHPRRTAGGELAQGVLDVLRADSEELQKRAYFLQMMKRAFSGGGVFFAVDIRHKRNAKRSAGAADRAVDWIVPSLAMLCLSV